MKQKLISLELITDKKLGEPLDYFSATNLEPAKLLYRLNNCWLMSDVCRDLFKLLDNYEVRFGDCSNKLRLTLDFLAMSHKLSFVFVSDGSLQQRVKTEVIAIAGERRTTVVCESEGIEAPFTLEN